MMFFWMEEISRNKRPEAYLMVVGNKLDLAKDRQVDLQEVKEFCQRHNIIHHEVSAKYHEQIEQAFNSLLQKI
jgi:GTPase SAR1 family protein